MDFLLYFILRRIFQRLELAPDRITVTKGLIFRRRCDIPVSAVTKIEIRRTPALRLLRGKRVEISTLCGGTFFYLRSWEHLPFLPEKEGASVKAGALQCIAGAFVDTRALSGVVTFALFLNRIGSVFGSESFSRIISAMVGAAEGITQLLSALHIGIPRVTATAAVFVGTAWLFVFLRKALGMLRFRLSCGGGFITIQRGVFTLYECRLVRNNLTACLRCDTLTTLLLRSAPLYCHDVMLFPPVDRRTADRLLSKLCRLPVNRLTDRVIPPYSAIFGHCAVPLTWFGLSASALLLTFAAEPTAADLLRSLLWCGAAISLWFVVTYAIYMRLSGASRAAGVTGLSFRRGARLYTAVIPDEKAPMYVLGRNIFQKFSGMCDITLAVAGRKRFKLRNVPHSDIKRLFLR
ncbi:MAG: PH domain-containing protein [Oscillospiraceae bacterium]